MEKSIVDIKLIINELKQKAREEQEFFNQQVQDYITRHSDDGCPYLVYRQCRRNYHNGEEDVLKSLEKRLGI